MMLRPSKHSRPDQTVLSAAYLVLIELRRRRIVPYSQCLALVRKRIEGGEFLFLPAINFLFLLGLVVYREKVDSFEIVKR